jgi:hypothetical protein
MTSQCREQVSANYAFCLFFIKAFCNGPETELKCKIGVRIYTIGILPYKTVAVYSLSVVIYLVIVCLCFGNHNQESCEICVNNTERNQCLEE